MPRSTTIDDLYRTHGPEAVRIAYLLTGDRDVADDIASEAFVKVFGRLHHIRNPSLLPFYLRKTILNLARMHFRATSRERDRLQREFLKEARASEFPDVDTHVDMGRLLSSLPLRQRAVLVLRFYADLSEAQVAAVLDCPVGTVKSLTARALTAMRRLDQEELT